MSVSLTRSFPNFGIIRSTETEALTNKTWVSSSHAKSSKRRWVITKRRQSTALTGARKSPMSWLARS